MKTSVNGISLDVTVHPTTKAERYTVTIKRGTAKTTLAADSPVENAQSSYEAIEDMIDSILFRAERSQLPFEEWRLAEKEYGDSKKEYENAKRTRAALDRVLNGEA